MTTSNPITDVLHAPLGPDWTIESLAEQILQAIANEPGQESFEFTDDATVDPQSRRLIRPLLACFATMSSAENGTAVNLYGGQLTFKRTDADRPIWILGQFQNQPGDVRISLRRSNSLSAALKATPASASLAEPEVAIFS